MDLCGCECGQKLDCSQKSKESRCPWIVPLTAASWRRWLRPTPCVLSGCVAQFLYLISLTARKAIRRSGKPAAPAPGLFDHWSRPLTARALRRPPSQTPASRPLGPSRPGPSLVPAGTRVRGRLECRVRLGTNLQHVPHTATAPLDAAQARSATCTPNSRPGGPATNPPATSHPRRR